jgi:hypothetical protein
MIWHLAIAAIVATSVASFVMLAIAARYAPVQPPENELASEIRQLLARADARDERRAA